MRLAIAISLKATAATLKSTGVLDVADGVGRQDNTLRIAKTLKATEVADGFARH